MRAPVIDSGRKTNAPDEPLSLRTYGAGKKCEWHKSQRKGEMLSVGEMLYSFERVSEDRMKIEASEDNGLTWNDHSALPRNISGFITLTVNTKSGIHIYVLCCSKYSATSAEQRENIAEVWLSKDGLKTFELVRENAEFIGNEVTTTCVRSDGSFYIFVIPVRGEPSSSWTSRDRGKTWQKLFRYDSQYNFVAPRTLGGQIVSFGYLLFALSEMEHNEDGDMQEPFELLTSADGGKIWKLVKVPFAPLGLVSDPNCHRLLCFSSKETYELCSGASEWKKMDRSWRSGIPANLNYESLNPVLFQTFPFASGTIMLRVIEQWVGTVIPRPGWDAVKRDKLTLAMTLAMFGIPSAVFTSFIAPFIFPF